MIWCREHWKCQGDIKIAAHQCNRTAVYCTQSKKIYFVADHYGSDSNVLAYAKVMHPRLLCYTEEDR